MKLSELCVFPECGHLIGLLSIIFMVWLYQDIIVFIADFEPCDDAVMQYEEPGVCFHSVVVITCA